MHMMVVDVALDGITVEGWRDRGGQNAQRFAEIPGLLAKVWLASGDEDDAVGAIYVFRDKQSMDDYQLSDLWKWVSEHPNNATVTARHYSVAEDLTRKTQPGLIVIE